MSNINKTIQNKTVFVTGGNNGIGEATSKYLASTGLNVVIFGRSSENGKRVEEEINKLGGGKALFVQGDVTSVEDQKRALEEGEKKFGSINFAFANAGVWGAGDGLLTNLENFRKVFDVNFFGALITLQQVAPYFKKYGGGSIVFNSSALGVLPRTNFLSSDYAAAYFISKTSVDGLVKVATALDKSHNIKAYSINPTVYISGMTSNDSTNPEALAKLFNLVFKKAGNPTDLGKVLESLFDGSTKYLSGQGIITENDITISSQYFYDIYSNEKTIDTNELISNHLRNAKGEKFSEKQLEEIKLRIKKIDEENNKN